jgi:lipid II:glycine glycyltransferase (peptidoglycan interpeptide bridge formation enzyme)
MNTPPLSERELQQRLQVFHDKTHLFVALHEQQPIAFLLCHATPSTMYFAKLPHHFQARKYQTNYLMCYHGIKYACDQGYQYVEFGLTFNKNQARWKSKFKGKQIPLRHFQKRCSTTHCLLYDAMDHLSWSFRNRSNIWKEKDYLA